MQFIAENNLPLVFAEPLLNFVGDTFPEVSNKVKMIPKSDTSMSNILNQTISDSRRNSSGNVKAKI